MLGDIACAGDRQRPEAAAKAHGIDEASRSRFRARAPGGPPGGFAIGAWMKGGFVDMHRSRQRSRCQQREKQAFHNVLYNLLMLQPWSTDIAAPRRPEGRRQPKRADPTFGASDTTVIIKRPP